MKISFSGEYKSLTSFETDDLPKLVIITGINGCGKSQLLELIQRSVSHKEKVRANIIGATFERNEVLLISSEWANLANAQEIGFDVVQKYNKSFWGQFEVFANRRSDKTHLSPLFKAVCMKLGKDARHVTQDEFTRNFDMSAPAAQTQVFNESISQAFFDFRINQLEALDKGNALSGDPPWDLLRQIICEARLPFEFNDPANCSLRSPYKFTLTHTGSGKSVGFSELSSGEKVLMSLAFWLFHVRRTGIFPRLLLLDEPDSHLHPEMCQRFLNVVNNVLVRERGVQVFLTTHNPTTVALSPRDSIYEMISSGERIRRASSKAEVIRRLSAGLVDLSEAKTIVIVEDEDDEAFYQCLFNELLTDELSKLPEQSLGDGEKLLFVQASWPRRQRKPDDSSGGRTEVEKWVPKLRDIGLDNIVGLVDRDVSNEACGSIYLLKRYSLENYLIDPVLVYACLVQGACEPTIPGVPGVSKSREHLIANWSDQCLQSVTDEITSRIRRRLAISDAICPSLDERVTVDFTNGRRLQYPMWICEMRGKNLLRAVIEEFGGTHVNQTKLTEMFRRLMLVPNELVDLLLSIQRRGKVI